jgi:hypothetical protein
MKKDTLFTSCYNYVWESIYNFNYPWMKGGMTKGLTLNVFYCKFSVIITCIGHHTVLKVIPIRETNFGTIPTSIRRVVLEDQGG